MVGCVITEMNAAGFWCRRSTAATVFGSCMSERIPSCMRAPPEAVTQTSGTPFSAARSHARANFSPTALPIEPPMKAKSMTASSQGLRSMLAAPAMSASPSPVAISASAIRSEYARRSKKPSGSAERRSLSCSSNVPRSASWSTLRRARTEKWCPHCGQTQRLSSSSSSR